MDGDLSKVCRLCLKGGEVMCPIFGPNQVNGNSVSLPIRIMACAQVKVIEGDGLPTNVCTGCLSQVDRSYNFKLLCEKSDSTLRGTANQKSDVKEEESDDESIGDMWDMTKFTPEVIINEGNDESNMNGCLENGLDGRFYAMTQVEEILRHQGTEIKVQPDGSLVHPPASNYIHPDGALIGDPSLLRQDAGAIVQGNQIMRRPEGTLIPNGFAAFLAVPQLQIQNPGPSPKLRKCRGGDKLFKCRQCNKSYSFSSALSRHKAVHNTALRPHVCQICNKGFTHFDKLLRHQKTHSLNSALVCNICGRAFTSFPAFEKHKSIGNCTELIKCKDCLIELPQDLLETHKCPGPKLKPLVKAEVQEEGLAPKASLPVQEAPPPQASNGPDSGPRGNKGRAEFACQVCQKCFATRSSLEVHSTIHTGLRPFVCNICQKSFRHKVNLMEHYQRKHSQVRPYSCDVCAVRFVTKQELVRHYRKHIGD